MYKELYSKVLRTSENDKRITVGSPAPLEFIDSAENFLGYEIPETFKAYLTTFGTLKFNSTQLLGYSENPEYNFKRQTDLLRKQKQIENHFFVFEIRPNEHYMCMDTFDSWERISFLNYVTLELEDETNSDFAYYIEELMEYEIK